MTVLLLLTVCVVAGTFCAIPFWFVCHGWRPARWRPASRQQRRRTATRAQLELVASKARLVPSDGAEPSR